MIAMSSDSTGYAIGEPHPNTHAHASFEFKQTTPGYTGGGYPRWRSTEHRPHTPRQDKEDVYVPVHRLLAVVACYPAEMPISEILADLEGKDVHHQLGMPAANLPGELSVRDHGDHSSITQAQVRAWAEDAKRTVQDAVVEDDDLCPECQEEMQTPCTSPDYSGTRCLECAMDSGAGEIQVGGRSR